MSNCINPYLVFWVILYAHTFIYFLFPDNVLSHTAYVNFVNVVQIFVFSTTKENWRLYDWSKITTLVECGYHDEEMVKFAHNRNVSVVAIGEF